MTVLSSGFFELLSEKKFLTSRARKLERKGHNLAKRKVVCRRILNSTEAESVNTTIQRFFAKSVLRGCY